MILSEGKLFKQGYIIFLLAALLSIGMGFAGFQILQTVQHKEEEVTSPNVSGTASDEVQLSSNETDVPLKPTELETENTLENNHSSNMFSSFLPDTQLQQIVDDAVQMVEVRGLPSQKFSISLVNLADDSCCTYASFNDATPRYPASVVKLFWLVILYDQYHNGVLARNSISEAEIHKMIFDSDNEPASRVLDLITQTSSGVDLPPDELDQWVDKRYRANYFFETLGYFNLNITQKTFPIPYLRLDGPEGREKQMRGDENQPVRNFLTTYSTARLLYEIDTEQAIAPEYNQRIKSHLLRNLAPDAWQYIPFNSIDGFLGEGLPSDSVFYSKAGWTSANRNDSAIIESPDGSVKYILVVFGDDAAFKEDEDIFPMISREIYRRLSHME